MVLAGGPKAAEMPLTAAAISVGRDDDNVIQLDDPLVSRHHAVLSRTDDTYTIRDLNSRNGTFVNGEPVREIALRTGDEVRVGGVTFRYEQVTISPQPTAAAEITQLTADNQTLKAEVAALRAELATAQSKIAERAKLDEQLAKAIAENAQLTAALSDCSRRAEQMQREQAHRQEQLAAMEVELAETKDRLANTQRELADLRHHHAALEQRAADSNEQAAALQRELVSVQQQAAARAAADHKRLAACEADCRSRDNTIRKLQEQLSGLARQLTAAEEKAAAATATAKRLETELEQAHRQVATLTAELATRAAAEQTWRHAAAAASAQAERVPELTRRNNELLAELAASQHQLLQLEQQLIPNESGVPVAEAGTADQASVLGAAARCKPRLAEVTARLVAVQTELHELRQRSACHEPAVVIQLQAELDQARQQAARATALEAQLEALRRENHDLADQLARSRQQVLEHHQQLAQQVMQEMKQLRRSYAAGIDGSAVATSPNAFGAAKVHPLSVLTTVAERKKRAARRWFSFLSVMLG